MQNLSNNHCKKSSQQTIEQKVVILRTPEFRQVSPLRRNHIATRRIKEGERLQKCLSFAEIQPKPNPGPDLVPLVWPLQIVPSEERNISDVNCEGNICQVQVSN